MSQNLYGRHYADAVLMRIVVQLPQLFPGIASPHIAEPGLSLQLIYILHIQDQAIQPHQRHAVQNISQKSGIRHTVPGGVNHNAYPGDIHFFCMVHLGLSPILPQNPQCPEQMNLLPKADPAQAALPCYPQRLFSPGRQPEKIHTDSIRPSSLKIKSRKPVYGA